MMVPFKGAKLPSHASGEGGDPTTRAFRVEHDALGEVLVPSWALYGAHTQRGCANFRVSGVTLRDRPQLIAAFGQVKVAAARASLGLGDLQRDVAEAIVTAGMDVAANHLDAHFPLDVVQGGGGTATNMNVNEVIANRAAELLGGARGAYDIVHPNDHVNRSQSTNDVYPTALQIAVLRECARTLEAVGHVAAVLRADGEQAAGLERLGRTCLQDALPVLVTATQNGTAHALDRVAGDLRVAAQSLLAVPLGATAVGTGLGAHPGFQEAALAQLAEVTGLPLVAVPNPYDSLAYIDKFLAVASGLVRIMLVMAKLAADLRLLSSGPVGGIGEVALPAVQVGSSIMPGKVNPVIPELVIQVAFEVRGAATVVEAATGAGELELNVMEPVVARHLLGALTDASAVSHLFADRCLSGLEWNESRLREHLAGSLADRVMVARHDGYAAPQPAQGANDGAP